MYVYIFAFACLSCKLLRLDYSVIGGLITLVSSVHLFISFALYTWI